MKKIFLSLLLVALMFGITAAPVSAWEPDHEIRYIVPYAPGGASDAIGRVVAEYLAEELKVPVVIDNVPGAACVIGWTELYNQPNDGYTISMASTVAAPWSVEVFSPVAPPWKADEFVPVGSATGIGSNSGIVCKRGRWPDLMSFLAEAKANPGKLKWGIIGPGQPNETMVWEFEKITGCDFNVVLYTDSASIQTDILTGDLDVGSCTAGRADFAANQSFSILVLLGDEFPPNYPVQGIPFLADFEDEIGFKWDELVYLPTHFVRQDIIVRADTPADVQARYEKAMENINNNEAYKKAITNVAWPYYLNPRDALADYHHLMKAWSTFLTQPEYEAWLEKIM